MKTAIEKQQIKEQIEFALDRCFQSFEKESVSYDFQGLQDYFCGQFLEDMNWLYEINPEEVERRKDTIISKAVDAAETKTEDAKQAVVKITNTLIETVRSFQIDKVPNETKVALNETVNAVAEKVESVGGQIVSEIKKGNRSAQEELYRRQLEILEEEQARKRKEHLKDDICEYVNNQPVVKTRQVANKFNITEQDAFDILKSLARKDKISAGGQLSFENSDRIAWRPRSRR